mmetsp:Transcript_146/g.353  ORF Transcript_146/g.353 Transcript_146/m.353 type:complete len:222 (-) Transcript_146:3325-3990(-)
MPASVPRVSMTVRMTTGGGDSTESSRQCGMTRLPWATRRRTVVCALTPISCASSSCNARWITPWQTSLRKRRRKRSRQQQQRQQALGRRRHQLLPSVASVATAGTRVWTPSLHQSGTLSRRHPRLHPSGTPRLGPRPWTRRGGMQRPASAQAPMVPADGMPRLALMQGPHQSETDGTTPRPGQARPPWKAQRSRAAAGMQRPRAWRLARHPLLVARRRPWA